MKKLVSLILVALMVLSLVPAMAENEEHEPVTITFGGWGDIVLLNEQVEKFEEKYPWITVDIVKLPGIDWYTNDLVQLAAEGNMPDVFNIEYPLTAYQNGWCYDLTEMFKNDPDSVNYPASFLDYGVVNNELIAMCGAVYARGIEVNLSILDELNIERPGYDWTLDEFADILRKIAADGTFIPSMSLYEMLGYIIPQYDASLSEWGYDVVNGEWRVTDALVKGLEYYNDLAKDGCDVEETIRGLYGCSWEGDEIVNARNQYLLEKYGANDALWYRGLMAMRTNDSWNMNWPANHPDTYSGFEWDFYPYPTATEGELARTALLNEWLSVSATTQHPYESYLLLKYMSFDMDGYEAKVDFMVNYDREAMLAKYPEIDPKFVPGTIMIYLIGMSTEARADEIFAKMNAETFPGMAAAFANRDNNGILAPQRYAPDFITCHDQNHWYTTNMVYAGVNPADRALNMVNFNTNKQNAAIEAYGFTYGYTE